MLTSVRYIACLPKLLSSTKVSSKPQTALVSGRPGSRPASVVTRGPNRVDPIESHSKNGQASPEYGHRPAVTSASSCRTVSTMPNYLVEHESADQVFGEWDRGLVLDTNLGVAWDVSFLSLNGGLTLSHCKAPSPEAVRASAQAHGFVVDRITQVTALRH